MFSLATYQFGSTLRPFGLRFYVFRESRCLPTSHSFFSGSPPPVSPSHKSSDFIRLIGLDNPLIDSSVKAININITPNPLSLNLHLRDYTNITETGREHHGLRLDDFNSIDALLFFISSTTDQQPIEFFCEWSSYFKTFPDDTRSHFLKILILDITTNHVPDATEKKLHQLANENNIPVFYVNPSANTAAVLNDKKIIQPLSNIDAMFSHIAQGVCAFHQQCCDSGARCELKDTLDKLTNGPRFPYPPDSKRLYKTALTPYQRRPILSARPPQQPQQIPALRFRCQQCENPLSPHDISTYRNCPNCYGRGPENRRSNGGCCTLF